MKSFKFKDFKNYLGLLSATLFVTACAPTASQLKKVIESDPSIVFAAIEKDPEKFIEVVNKAARDSQGKAQEKAQREEDTQREEEFKNPKTAEVQADRVIFGPKEAKVTVIEYSDFECPYCARGYSTVKEVLKAYPNEVRVVFKHLPLDFHPKAMPAAQMFEAIAKQDHAKATKFHDAVFENPNDLRSKGEAWMKETAKKLGVDMKKLDADMKSEAVKKRIEADMEEAKKFGFSGTPGFLINGVSLKGAYPFPEFKKIIDKHLGK